MTVTSNKQIAEELITALFTNGDLTAVDLFLDQSSSTMTGHCQIRRIGLRACVNQAEFPPRLTWCPRNAARAPVMGEPPTGRNVVFCGVNIFCIADGTIVERWRPERSPLDVAPDRRLADLELGGADRAALAQCAKFGQ